MFNFFLIFFPPVPSDAQLLKRKAAAYEEERSKTLAENKARMVEVFKAAHISKRLPMEDFEDVARRFVYDGSREPVTKPTKKSKIIEEKETHPDPTYEPDADEMATAEDDLGTDEEELSADNTKKKVAISYFFQIVNLKNAIVTLLMCSFLKNNQAKDVPPTTAMKKHATPAVPESTVTTRSKAPTVTQPTESASADTSTRPDGEDAELQITPTENLTSRGSNSPEDNQIVITKQKGIHIFTSICLLLVTTKLL